MTCAERGGAAAALLWLGLAACGGGGDGGAQGATGGGDADANVLRLSVNGEACGGGGAYANQPCVEVTVCEPGTRTCTTVDHVLLDTGSYGLRLFRQALGELQLPAVPAAGGGALATCVQFADLSSDWGPVHRADVVLGGEPAVEVPIHVVDAGFGALPPSCTDPEPGPAEAGFNGILGVGVFPEDCGRFCEADADNGLYFACDGEGCRGVAAPAADQVQNPVARLPGDNNGVVVELPGVDPGGAAEVEGRLVLGIGTRANNAVAGATVVPLDPHVATFATVLEGRVIPGSFIDTGSNGLFFAPPSTALPSCPAPASAWYCPEVRRDFTARNTSSAGGEGVETPFQIDHFLRLVGSGRRVFPSLGGPSIPGAGFDWGLPFFLGRRVAIGYEGRSSTLGPGPLAAY